MSLRREDYTVWQDSEVRIDGSRASCQLRRGEAAIDALDSVEDSKGASGERGRLTVTTLRLLWVSHANPGHNVSIGWDAMAAGRAGLAVRSAQSRLRGSLQALVVAAAHEGAKFDFLFTSLVKASPRLFATAQAVHKAYETSRAYRALRLRGAIIRPEDRSVVLLPRERVFTQLDGVWNLANDSGNLGACTVTSQRFVWRANLTENFNVSIPYLIMSKVSIVNHAKFGPTLVMALSERSGGSLFGFRVEPAERMAVLEKEVVALREACFTAPDFGVTYTLEDEGGGEGGAGAGSGAGSGSAPLAAGSEDVEIVSAMRVGREAGGGRDAYAAYLAEGSKAGDRAVVFSHELGLAVEAPPAGMSVSELWLTL